MARNWKDPSLWRAVNALGLPIIFATLSGSDLYGFPSSDGDYDVRGAHVLNNETLWAGMLREGGADSLTGLTIERSDDPLDMVYDEIGKCLRLALKSNGNVLEQITSPYIIITSTYHEELKSLVPGILTSKVYYHYRGFFTNQMKVYNDKGEKRVKGLLYRYRVALTGIHALRHHVIEPNIHVLNEWYKSSLIPELVAMKVNGEAAYLTDDRPYLAEIEKIRPSLDEAYAQTKLPAVIDDKTYKATKDLLYRIRRELGE